MDRRVIRSNNRKRRRLLIEDLFGDREEGQATDVRSPIIRDEGNYTPWGERTEFGWQTANPFEMWKGNDTMADETVYDTSTRRKRWNGQGLA